MSRTIQIRNVPDALHRQLKARAANSGQTLSDYLLGEIGRVLVQPTRQQVLARIGRKRATLTTPAAVVIRAERGAV